MRGRTAIGSSPQGALLCACGWNSGPLPKKHPTNHLIVLCFQVVRQFPLSFEFNQYFLKFLAYHYVSNRFRTFMLDNEFERVEAGWLLDERRPGGVSVEEVVEGQGFSPKHGLSQGAGGCGLWDYVDKQHRKSAIFTNFMFSPHDQEPVSAWA